MVTFGQRLKEIRKEKNITLEKLAKELKTTKATLSRYENNLRDPKSDFIKKIAIYFDVSVDYLLGKTDIKTYKDNILANPEKLTNDNSELTKRDEKEITRVLEETRKKLENTEGLMFNGEPASPEAVESILQAMEMGMALAKQKNKEKYTPKKYRENK